MAPTEEDLAWFKSTFHPPPKPVLPDDCIEYSLYYIDEASDRNNESEVRLKLRQVQKHAAELQKEWLKDYVWQRQSFSLELSKQDGEVCIANGKDIGGRSDTISGLSVLRGRTDYGDSIEDEWVVVWLLRELTKKFDNLWVKVTDSDGEFLLIEASADLPTWLEPDVAENRVWITDGRLKIIKPARTTKRTTEKLSVEDAYTIILGDKKRIMHSAKIEEQAFHRLRNYPDQIKQNMHHALLTIPRKLAYLLIEKPAYVAPAVEAFYLRDPLSLKPLRNRDTSDKLIFPPVDLVTISVTSPRVAYAQLKSQDFDPPSFWTSKLPSSADEEGSASAITGMKLTCGFEMLLSDSKHQDHLQVREMKLLLEDVESGEIALPTNDTIAQLPRTADSEEWLDINFEDLQNELQGSSGKQGQPSKPDFADKAAQENLQRIVKQFESFLENEHDDPKNLFGADSDDEAPNLDDPELNEGDDISDDETDPAFGADEFTKLMQEMMGMPPEVMKELMAGNIDALKDGNVPAPSGSAHDSTKGKVADDESSSEYDEQEIENVTRQIGQELRDYGALPGSSKDVSARPVQKANRDVSAEDVEDDESDLDEDDPWNAIDENLAKEMLETLQARGSGGAPPNNLLQIMERLGIAEEMKTRFKQ